MANRKQLMESMESFLCSFAYSSPDMNDFGMGMSSGMGMGMERVTPFLMYAHTLGSKVRHDDNGEGLGEEWTIADLIISGALDRPSSLSGKERELGQQRAWIASANDFIFVPSSRPTSVILAPEPSAASISRERRKGSDGSEGSGGHAGILTPPEGMNLHQGTPGVTLPTPVFQHQRSSSAWSGSQLYGEEPILTVLAKGGEGVETKVQPLTPSDSGSDSSTASLRPRQPGNGTKRMSIALTIPKFGGGASGDKNLKMKMSMSSGRWRFWKGAGVSAAST